MWRAGHLFDGEVEGAMMWTAQLVIHNASAVAIFGHFSHTIHNGIDFQNQHLARNRASRNSHQSATAVGILYIYIFLNNEIESEMSNNEIP